MPRHHDETKEGASEVNPGALPAEESAPEPKAPEGAARAAAAPEGGDLVGTRIAELEELNELLRTEISSLKDQYLRKVADFDNFRKRINKDKEDSVAFANNALLLDLIGVLDDYDRALKAVGPEERETVLFKGLEMTERQMIGLLESKWGLQRYGSAGEEFDPNRHEAIGAAETPEVQAPTVKEEYMKGYALNGRVIRPAKVFVNMPVQGAARAEADPADGGAN